MGIIYCATNIKNGKRYVGKTTQSLRKRWQQHIVLSRLRDDLYFCRAIRKHGPDSFELCVLEEIEDAKLLGKAEQKWIADFKTTDSNLGYNSTYGGEGEPQLPETRLRIGKAISSLWDIPENLEKWSRNRKGNKNPMYGKVHKETSKLLQSQSRKEWLENSENREILIQARKKSAESRRIILPENLGASYVSGKNCKQLAEEFGCAEKTIWDRLKAAGIKMRSRGSRMGLKERKND